MMGARALHQRQVPVKFEHHNEWKHVHQNRPGAPGGAGGMGGRKGGGVDPLAKHQGAASLGKRVQIYWESERYICVYVCVCICLCVYTHVYVYTHTHIHVYKHIHMLKCGHTHKGSGLQVLLRRLMQHTGSTWCTTMTGKNDWRISTS